MFCTQCGAVITNEQAMFCPQCGSPTKRADSVQPSYEVPEEAPPIEEPYQPIDESTTVLTADQRPYSDVLSQPNRPNMAAMDQSAEMDMGTMNRPQGSRASTLNQRSAVGGVSENNTEILDSPYVMNNTDQQDTVSGTGERKSGALKWILIGAGAFVVVLIIIIGIIIGVVLPRAKDADGEITGKDEQQEVTPEELDNIIASVDTEEPEVTESDTPELTATEAPSILASELVLEKSLANLMVGETITIAATVYPEDVTDSSVVWSSDNPEIAEVDANGIITGKSFGTVTIYCSTADGSGITGACSVMVTQTPSQAFVAHLYKNCLGRAAAGSEIQGWADRIDDGTFTPGQVAASFCRSEELGGANFGNEDFMKVVYRTYLNREFDQAGLDSWVAKLNDGMSRDEVLELFAGTSEFHQVLADFGLE